MRYCSLKFSPEKVGKFISIFKIPKFCVLDLYQTHCYVDLLISKETMSSIFVVNMFPDFTFYAYASGHLVRSHLGLAYVLLVETNLFPEHVVMFFRTMLFEYPSVLSRFCFNVSTHKVLTTWQKLHFVNNLHAQDKCTGSNPLSKTKGLENYDSDCHRYYI